MRLKDEFIAQAKRDNWHFNFIKRTSLGPLITVLDSPPFIPQCIAAEIVKIPAGKIEKYKCAFAFLHKRFPTLQKFIDAHKQSGIGLTDQNYAPGKEVRRKDIDGRWYRFELQRKGNSCGPTCIRIILSQYTNLQQRSERQIRDDVGLLERGVAHQGITKSNHDWVNVGSLVQNLVNVMISYGIRNASSVHGDTNYVREQLKKASKNNPAIVGWWWGAWGDNSHGGHWTVCVGPTRMGNRLVILDPWEGVQYIDTDQYWFYNVNGSQGWFDPRENDAAVIVTHPK